MELVGLYPVNALRNRALMLAQTEVRRQQGRGVEGRMRGITRTEGQLAGWCCAVVPGAAGGRAGMLRGAQAGHSANPWEAAAFISSAPTHLSAGGAAAGCRLPASARAQRPHTRPAHARAAAPRDWLPSGGSLWQRDRGWRCVRQDVLARECAANQASPPGRSLNPWRMEGAAGAGVLTGCALPCMPRLLQGIVLPAFETMDDGEVGKQTALKAIKSECVCLGARGASGSAGLKHCWHLRSPPAFLSCGSHAQPHARAVCWSHFLLSPACPALLCSPAAGRDSLAELFKRGELRGFHMDHYNRGHRCATMMPLLLVVVHVGAHAALASLHQPWSRLLSYGRAMHSCHCAAGVCTVPHQPPYRWHSCTPPAQGHRPRALV